MNINWKEKIISSLGIISILIGLAIGLVMCCIYPNNYIIILEGTKPISKYIIIAFLLLTTYAIIIYNIDIEKKSKS